MDLTVSAETSAIGPLLVDASDIVERRRADVVTQIT
jgi:hypothetical protein